MPVTVYYQKHRHKINAHSTPLLNALVARKVGRQELLGSAKAKAAMQKEWDNLSNKGCWDIKSVREMDDVRAEAKRTGKTIHLSRVAGLCTEKGSELAPDDPKRKYKGRVVYLGNQVRDEKWDHALFEELTSAPSTMQAGKALDAYGMFKGNTVEMSDAEQAYTQAKLDSPIVTWIELPSDQWPKEWIGKYRRPVVILKLALYGHPDSGGYWERHCEAHLFKCGFKRIDGWNSCYFNKELKLFLTVYVDDFKMAGPRISMIEGWKRLRKGIQMEDPKPLGPYLGCQEEEGTMIIRDRSNPLHPEIKPRKTDNPDSVIKYQGSGKLVEVRAVKYDQELFTKSCVERYLELSKDKRNAKLSKVDTPFLDVEDEPFDPENSPKGVLAPIASKVLMKVLYAARMARWDLLKPVGSLASRVTKWTPACDKQLHRLMCYLNCTQDVAMHGWVGDSMEDVWLELYTDADFAGCPDTLRSTSGVLLALVGPNTFFPLHGASKKQGCVSHSTTEAEIVAADFGLRTEGIPAVSLWETLLGRTPELRLAEDNQATLRIIKSGKNPQMRYLSRTHKVNLSFMFERALDKTFVPVVVVVVDCSPVVYC